jgi:hypothetical protein
MRLLQWLQFKLPLEANPARNKAPDPAKSFRLLKMGHPQHDTQSPDLNPSITGSVAEPEPEPKLFAVAEPEPELY